MFLSRKGMRFTVSPLPNMTTNFKTCIVLGLSPDGTVSVIQQTEDAQEATRKALTSEHMQVTAAWKLDTRGGGNARLLKRHVNASPKRRPGRPAKPKFDTEE